MERIFRIPPPRLLHAGAEGEHIVAQMEGRIHGKVEVVVRRIAIDDSIRAGQRDLAARVTDLEKSACIRHPRQMQVVARGPLSFQGGPGCGQQALWGAN